MKSILGKFLKGLLYFLTLPGLIILLAFVSVIGLIYFIGLGIKGIILFFQGKSLFKDLPEDMEVRRIKDSQIPPSDIEEKKEAENNPSMLYTTQNFYDYSAPLADNTTEKKEEVVETKQEDNIISEEPLIKPAEKSTRIETLGEDDK